MRVSCIARVAGYVVVLHLGVDTMYQANHWKGWMNHGEVRAACTYWIHASRRATHMLYMRTRPTYNMVTLS